MTSEGARELCLKLINADTEEQVIALLKSMGYWDDDKVWRLYGDEENNWGIIGAQQATPDAALVEKLTNSGDALLLLACRDHGIDPESADAPNSINEAIARFFKGSAKNGHAGRVVEWTPEEVTKLAERITICATGYQPEKGSPSLTIADDGEGQTPDMMPKTFLSLAKSNKDRVRFVQGRFNMGGTGVLRFGGHWRLQLIVSRRAPGLVEDQLGRDGGWGFTVVRRESARTGEQNSKFRYLAPVTGQDHLGQILTFKAERLPIFPKAGDQNNVQPRPYARESDHGTLIKLYEYRLMGNRSNIVQSRKGLRQRLDMLLAGVALPARVYECRQGYRGKAGSYASNVGGLLHKLNLERQKNIEDGFPLSDKIVINGESFRVDVYALKEGTSKSYKESEGVIFTLNGQVHAILPKSYFATKSIGLGYVKDDLLVVVDLSALSSTAREDLVMTSRDRLSSGPLAHRLQEDIAGVLKANRALNELQQRRREQDVAQRLADDKPLEHLLKDILKRSPDLSRVLGVGQRLSSPFDVRTVKPKQEFKGTFYPTWFRFKGKPYGHTLERPAYLERRCRIDFETDAENSFFTDERGTSLTVLAALEGRPVPVDYTINPDLGTVHLYVRLPEDAQADQTLMLRVELQNAELLESFINEARISIRPAELVTRGPKGPKPPPPSEKPGPGAESTGGIDLPPTFEHHRDTWDKLGFDQFSALIVKPNTVNGRLTYDYHVNMDNIYLLTELKYRPADAQLLGTKFKLALVLISMAVVNDASKALQRAKDEEPAVDDDPAKLDVETLVQRTTEAVAPIVLPMIASLSTLSEEDRYDADLEDLADAVEDPEDLVLA